jgi:hypothetical protein
MAGPAGSASRGDPTGPLQGQTKRSTPIHIRTEWTRIGIAVQNDDGSFDLRFDYLPMRLAETAIEMREMDAMATAQTE